MDAPVKRGGEEGGGEGKGVEEDRGKVTMEGL